MQLEELIGISGIERELADCAIIYDSAQLGAGGVHQRCFRRNLDRLLRCTRLQSGVESEDLIDLQHHVRADVFLKSLQRVFDPVLAGNNLHERVVATLVRFGIAADAGRIID